MIFTTKPSVPLPPPPAVVTIEERTPYGIVEISLNGTVVASFLGSAFRVSKRRINLAGLALIYTDSHDSEVVL